MFEYGINDFDFALELFHELRDVVARRADIALTSDTVLDYSAWVESGKDREEKDYIREVFNISVRNFEIESSKQFQFLCELVDYCDNKGLEYYMYACDGSFHFDLSLPKEDDGDN